MRPSAQAAQPRGSPTRSFVGCLLAALVVVSLLSTQRWGRCAAAACSRARLAQRALSSTPPRSVVRQFPGLEDGEDGKARRRLRCAPLPTPLTRACGAQSVVYTSGSSGPLLVSRRTAAWDRLYAEGLFSDAYPRVPLSEQEARKRDAQARKVAEQWPGGAWIARPACLGSRAPLTLPARARRLQATARRHEALPAAADNHGPIQVRHDRAVRHARTAPRLVAAAHQG